MKPEAIDKTKANCEVLYKSYNTNELRRLVYLNFVFIFNYWHFAYKVLKRRRCWYEA
jgi:hypothetical protein